MRILITGSSGFVGSHLTEYLLGAGAEVFGIARKRCAAAAGVVLPGSILDIDFLRQAVLQASPTRVFHCAAALPGGNDAKLVYETNVIGTSNLFAALAAEGSQAVIVIAGSSAVYGRPESLPVTEDHPFDPLTDYGASKVEQEMVARSHFLSHGTSIVVARTFNLIGPRQSPSLVASGLAQQIALAERGGPAIIRVGNLDARRDYTDVRDAVRAFALLADHGVPGSVYNVCSGVSRSVREALDILMAEGRVQVTVEVDRERLKESEVDDQRGSFERLRYATGWEPVIGFEQSLRDLLNDWRSRMERGIVDELE